MVILFPSAAEEDAPGQEAGGEDSALQSLRAKRATRKTSCLVLTAEQFREGRYKTVQEKNEKLHSLPETASPQLFQNDV